MDAATRRLFAIVLVALVVFVGGAAIFLSESSMPDDAPDDATVAVGVVVGVDGESLGDVRSFDLRLGDGSVRTFGLAELENGDQFPPGHLAEHQVTAEPVRVWYRPGPEGDQAIRLEDAPR